MFTCDLDKFVDRETILAEITDKIDRLAKGHPFAPNERVVHILGPSDIGKSCLLEKFYKTFDNEPKCIPVLIKLETLGSGSEGFIGSFIEAVNKEFCKYQKIPIDKKNGSLSKFGSDVTRKIIEYTEDFVVILLLDEINIPQKDEMEKIEEHLLGKLIEGSKRVVLITSGRDQAELNVFSLRPNAANTYVLMAFDENLTRDQLEKLKPGTAYLASKFLIWGGGFPGKNKKLVEQTRGDPPRISNELQTIQMLLKEAKSKMEIEDYFHSVIEAICILPDFNPDDVLPLLDSHPLLENQWSSSKLGVVFTRLRQVQIGPGELIQWDRKKRNYVIDEPTRVLFEMELRMRDITLWKKLHCVAHKMYKNWGDEFNSQPFKKKAAYHQQKLESAGMGCDDLEVKVNL